MRIPTDLEVSLKLIEACLPTLKNEAGILAGEGQVPVAAWRPRYYWRAEVAKLNTIHTPMVEAEFSANAEKAAPSQSVKAHDSRKLQMALSVQPLKGRT